MRSCLYGDQREPSRTKVPSFTPKKSEPQPPLPLPWPLSTRNGHVASSPSSSLGPPSAEVTAPLAPPFLCPISTVFSNGDVPSLSTTAPLTANSHDGSVFALPTTTMPEATSLSSCSSAGDSRYSLAGGVSRCCPADSGGHGWSALGGAAGAHGCCSGGAPLFADHA